MCKVISVVNQKGGVGKTTTTVNVGIGLAREEKKVLLIDADPQGSLTASLGYEEPDDLRITLATMMMDVINEEDINLEDGILHHQENVDLLPANIELSALEVTMGNVMSREMIMKEYIDAIRSRYDYILIDCMPSLGMMTINALVSSDSVLIPVQAAYLPVKGLQQLIKTILTVKKRLNRKLAIEGILLTMVDFRTNYARDIASRVHTTYVYDLSGSKKPVKRLWISSLEDSAILDGMQHLRSAEEYRHLAEAAVCRSQADWLVGMNATRAYTTKYFKKLTVGRVQTPTLAMLVERAGQISNFQKEKYFNVELDCDGIPAVKPKIFDPDEAEQLRSRCHGNEAIVTSVKETEKKVKAPKLYDLTTLQREANRIYGMTAKQTLDTAQSLYEKKLITYPRTDSQYLTEDMEQTARNVVRQIYEKYQLTGPFDQPEQPDVKKVMNNSKVTDHHAIIPTMELASSHLDELKSWEEKILFLIAVHTVMAMSKDHIYQETEIEVECQGEIFKAKGRTVLQDGWKLFENCFKNKDRMAIVDPDQEMKERIPKVTQGQTFYAVAAEKTEHFTSPPKPYSEDTLLAAMETAGNKEFDEDTEKKGLGTPATRAGIIEKLIYSQYATRKGKQILPTDDGKVLVEILPDFLKSASMTAEWENQLLLMEHGEIAPEQFMTGIKNMLTMMLNGCDAISEEETRRFQTRESIGTCPVCGSLVYESKTNFYCSNHDCHFALWKDNRYLQSMEKTMDKKMAAELLKSGCVHVKDLYSRKKNMYFEADLHMDADETGRVNFSLSFPKKKPKNKSKKK